MRRDVTLRILISGAPVLLGTVNLLGQKPSAAVPYSPLPANPSTSLSADVAKRPASHRAGVTYTAGLLTVSAANSSLREILQDIASATGMKVTGLVSDDRVFGRYGPAAPAEVLNTLLDGTGSNMLLIEDAHQNPTELVLTPQRGGATPPNPNAASASDGDVEDVIQAQRPLPGMQQPGLQQPGMPGPGMQGAQRGRPNMNLLPTQGMNGGWNPNQPAPNPAATQPSTSTETVVFPPIDVNSTPSTGTATPNSATGGAAAPGTQPDTVKTPQQIFEQLQKLRQQQQSNPTTAPQ